MDPAYMCLTDLHSEALAGFLACAGLPCSCPRQALAGTDGVELFCPSQASPFPCHQACMHTQARARGRKQQGCVP